MPTVGSFASTTLMGSRVSSASAEASCLNDGTSQKPVFVDFGQEHGFWPILRHDEKRNAGWWSRGHRRIYTARKFGGTDFSLAGGPGFVLNVYSGMRLAPLGVSVSHELPKYS